MVAVKMFWDMWKNLTSATTNWSFTGGSGGGAGNGGGGQHGSNKPKGSSKPTRYNRLQSSYGPSKSQSHPGNLSLASNLESASSSSSSSLESLGTATTSVVPTLRSIEPTSFATTTEALYDSKSRTRWNGNNSSCSTTIKHSFSSTFPLTSSSNPPTSAALPTPKLSASVTSTNINPKLHPPPFLPSPEDSQILNQAGNNQTVGRNLDNGQGSCWKAAKKGNVAPSQTDNFSDLDEKVTSAAVDDDADKEDSHPTCEVCERAFPTSKKLADHQRKKRHYGCIQCDSIFPSRKALECHREQMCHYECGDSYDYDEEDSDSFQTEDDENGLGDYSEDCDDEEMERLL